MRCREGRISVDMLPIEITRERRAPTASPAAVVVPSGSQMILDRILNDGASFWAEVYEPFMARDITRHDVRELVRLGLEHTRGNYKLLVAYFNMPPEDYKKFLNFLRKYQCHVPFPALPHDACDSAEERLKAGNGLIVARRRDCNSAFSRSYGLRYAAPTCRASRSVVGFASPKTAAGMPLARALSARCRPLYAPSRTTAITNAGPASRLIVPRCRRRHRRLTA